MLIEIIKMFKKKLIYLFLWVFKVSSYIIYKHFSATIEIIFKKNISNNGFLSMKIQLIEQKLPFVISVWKKNESWDQSLGEILINGLISIIYKVNYHNFDKCTVNKVNGNAYSAARSIQTIPLTTCTCEINTRSKLESEIPRITRLSTQSNNLTTFKIRSTSS